MRISTRSPGYVSPSWPLIGRVLFYLSRSGKENKFTRCMHLTVNGMCQDLLGHFSILFLGPVPSESTHVFWSAKPYRLYISKQLVCQYTRNFVIICCSVFFLRVQVPNACKKNSTRICRRFGQQMLLKEKEILILLVYCKKVLRGGRSVSREKKVFVQRYGVDR